VEVEEADSPLFLLSPTPLPLYFILLSSHYLHLLLRGVQVEWFIMSRRIMTGWYSDVIP